MINQYLKCELCMRRCGVDRSAGRLGYCGTNATAYVSRAALHMWEEPPISGTRGSGTVFFSGCSLGCVFCQNRAISRGMHGATVSDLELADIMLRLADEGAHNINFVTPTHYAPTVIASTKIARQRGLSVPIVYNTGSYDAPETIKSLSGTVDVYLPDLKYYLPKTAVRYSHAEDYPTAARAAIAEMVAQVGTPIFDGDIMIRGVMVRILLLPSHLAEAKLSLKYLYSTYGDSIYLSLMNQYTPPSGMQRPIDRKVTKAEYAELCDYADTLGVKNCFVQAEGTAEESYIPEFNTSIP